MVIRSLILKVYLYAVVTLVITFVLTIAATKILMNHGMTENIRNIGADYATFIASEVEKTIHDGQPSQARIDALAKSLHVKLTYVPAGVSESLPYPPALMQREWVKEQFTFRSHHRYWVKLAPGGEFQGALRVEFIPPDPAKGHSGWIFAGFLIGALALMIVPPLYLWVLRPLKRMVDKVHHLGMDLTVPVANDRKDEFGELEGSFEALRQRIQRMLSQKERLLTDISHELRAPLSRMAIAVPLIRSEAGDSSYLDHIERNMQAMDRLIGELLTLSRGQTPPEREQESLDLAEMARELIAEREIVMEQRGLALETHLEAAPVRGDRRLLERAMGNLIDNAVTYGAGRIRVETGPEGNVAAFRVVDAGPGVPEADLPHLFEPFYRPDASRSRHTGGTGLGLAIVRAVAQSHGGEATLTSRLGEGSTATLRLPSKLPES